MRRLAQNSEAKLSFWGKRYIVIGGDASTRYSSDFLANKAIELLRLNPHFNEMEREIGKVFANRIDQIYNDSDRLVNQSNWFTNILASIRDLLDQTRGSSMQSYACSLTRWRWRECERDVYEGKKGVRQIFHRFYTREQYQEVFAEPPPTSGWETTYIPDHRIRWSAPRRPGDYNASA